MLRPAPSGPVAGANAPAAIRTLAVLFKLRIVGMLVLASVAGAFLGAGGWPGAGPLAVLILAGGMASAGASALNEYLERDQDARMRRTAHRPLACGAIARPGLVPAVGLALIAGPALAVLPYNPPLALFTTLGAVIYVGVYTLWLKPRTTLNIVIGGAAGSCAVLGGGAAVGAWADPGVVSLALVVFAWTPLHFWSLALTCREDYVRVGVPMLPARLSPRRAAFWILLHAVAAGVGVLALGALPRLGPFYLLPVTLATGALLWHAGRLLAQPTINRARSLFKTSNLYLGLVLLILIFRPFS